MTTLTILLTFVSVFAYLWVGLGRRSRVTSGSEYFIAGQNVSSNDYANVSVGYALQMAAMFLFAYWGFVYGIGALWTAVFWAGGYVVLYLVLPRFKQYRSVAGTQTLHSFIRQQFSSTSTLQKTAAAATLVGLMGTMLAEVDYTVAVYHPALDLKPLVLQALFLGLGLAYVIWNGFKAEVNTEQVQVPLAYIGLLAVLLLTLPQVYVNAGARTFYLIVGVTGATLLIMTLGKVMDITARGLDFFKWLDWQASIPLVALMVLLVECLWTSLMLTPGTASSVLDKPLGAQLLAQGMLGLFSLLIANVLWMPVDLSTWQRVGSVAGTDQEALTALKKGTFRVMLESPASWCLGAVLGWTINAGGYVPADYTDPYLVVAAFADRLYKGDAGSLLGSWQPVLYPVFVVSCVAIMLSTVTSIMSAVSFTAARDLVPGKEDNVSTLRLLTTILLILGLVVYEGLRSIFSANLPTLLYGAYSAQLSLFVVAMLALFESRRSARAAQWSITTGLVCAAISTVIAMLRPARVELAVLPPLFAVVGSLIGYVAGYELVQRRQPEKSTAESA